MFAITAGQRGVNAVEVVAFRDYNKKAEKMTPEKSVGEFYGYRQNQVAIM